MPKNRPFQQVDVFTATPLAGNPVAVVLDGTGLDTDTMQAFTNWTNLSEATFLVPPTHPDADYAVRIFCPGRELPFAGHPTLGTCHAWLSAGGIAKGLDIVQECGVGLVRIRNDAESGALAFAAPPLLRSGPLGRDDLDRIARGLGLAPAQILAHQWCDNGPPWQAVMVPSVEVAMRLQPDPQVLSDCFIGVVAPADGSAGDVDFEVRAFFPTHQGLSEDPVTGSLNAALAQWLIAEGSARDRYVVQQGTALGRSGRVYLEAVDGQVWVGGQCVTVIEGTATI